MIYKKARGEHSRSVSFENPAGKKGCAATENKGAKGHAFDKLYGGQTVTLMNFEGSGRVTSIWMTFMGLHEPVEVRSQLLRSLILRCYWDNNDKPAVEVPIGDFMTTGLNPQPFENEFFSSPEGKSFNVIIPMPFKTHSLITLTNESDIDMSHLFYTVNFVQTDMQEDDLYFHAYFNRENPNKKGVDYTILPKVTGSGRFLGVSVTMNANEEYGHWWGEGEFKAYIDGDILPTICGTGAEDYAGTGWGLGKFVNRFQGCTTADEDLKTWSFYRFHVPDPIVFYEDIYVTIQAIGGDKGKSVRETVNKGMDITPVSADMAYNGGGLVKFLENEGEYDSSSDKYDEAFVNFYREDDYSSVAYFYLDSAVSCLPNICKTEERVCGLRCKGDRILRDDV